MGRKKRKKYVITSGQLFDANKPQFNGFNVGHGAHGDKKYNRRKEIKEFKRLINS